MAIGMKKWLSQMGCAAVLADSIAMAVTKRTVLNPFLAIATLALVFFGMEGNATPVTVLDFEGLQGPHTAGATLPDNYGGFTWGAYAGDVTEIFSGWGASSGAWYVLVGSGGQPLVAANSATPFDLISVFLTRGNPQPDSVLIQGFADISNSTATFTRLITPTESPAEYLLNFSGIERVLFTPIAAGPYEYRIGLDDFAFLGTPTPIVLPSGSSIPEPATFALLGLGLAGLCFTRRKQLLIQCANKPMRSI